MTVNSGSYLDGSMKKYSSSGYTDTCLSPNGNGYVSGIEIISNIYTNVSKIVVGNIDTFSSGLSDSDLSVIPQSYQTSGTYNDPLIMVTNQTSIKTKISTSMTYLLDSNNNPEVVNPLDVSYWLPNEFPTLSLTPVVTLIL